MSTISDTSKQENGRRSQHRNARHSKTMDNRKVQWKEKHNLVEILSDIKLNDVQTYNIRSTKEGS